MTIRLLLRSVFIASTVMLVLLLIIVSLLKNGLIESAETAQKRFELVQLAELSAQNSKQLTKLARQYVITLDPTYKDQYNALVAQIQGDKPWDNGRQVAYMDWLKEYGVKAEDLAYLDQSNTLSMDLVNTEVAAFELVESLEGSRIDQLTDQQHELRNKAVMMLYDDAYEREVEKIARPVGQFLSLIEEHSAQEVQEKNNEVNNLSLLSITFVVVMIALLAVTYFVLEKRVIKTIKSLVAEAKRIASGDLTRKINLKGKDEMAQLAMSFDEMIEKLASLLGEISSQAEQAQSSSSELDQIAGDARKLNDQQNEAIEVISSSVYENSVAVKEVAKNCSDAAENASHVERKTAEGEVIVRSGIEAVESVASVMNASIEKLADLEQSVEQVTAILNVISSIAEQTNLLALNAAIEAARAGEQGRGFAVVADEVRTLAARTQESTIEIQDNIGTLQSVTKSVTSSIHGSDESVKQAVEQSENIGAMLSEITTLVKSILDMNQSIAAASEEQSKVTDDISERLTSIRDGSIQAKRQTEEVSQSSDELSRIASTLMTQVKTFSLPK